MIESTRDTIGILARAEGMVTNRTRFKIFQAVAAIHILVVAGPFIGQVIWRMVNPPPKRVMNIRMITRLPDEVADTASSAIGGAPAPPPIQAVRPQQRPAPQQPAIKPVAFKPPPIKPVKQQTAVKPPPVKVTQAKPVRKTPQKPTKPQQTTPVAVKPQPDKNFTPISDNDWQSMNTPPQATNNNPATSSNSSSASRPGPPGDNVAGDKFRLDYSQFVAQYLKENWDTPSRIQLGGREPEVTIRLHFAPSGQITSWTIVKSSGIAIMDNSVEKLMRFVKKIPQPPPKDLTELTLILAIND